MMLLCNCINSTASALYGNHRPHTRLVKHQFKPQEYCCEFCNYVRTEAEGKRSGVKKGVKK